MFMDSYHLAFFVRHVANVDKTLNYVPFVEAQSRPELSSTNLHHQQRPKFFVIRFL